MIFHPKRAYTVIIQMKGGIIMKNEKNNTLKGAEKLLSKMIDREYAEMADLPENQIWTDDPDSIFDPEEQIDETKDTDIKGR